MGTNFYTPDDKHIGKRYAAGIGCYDCRCQTVMVSPGGKMWTYAEMDSISGLFNRPIYIGWKCPQCGNYLSDKDFEKQQFSAAHVELGFQKISTTVALIPTGIASCSGFIWQVGPTGVATSIEGVKKVLSEQYETVIDSYDTILPVHEFLASLRYVIPESTSDGEFS